MEIDVHIRNNLFPTLFTIIKFSVLFRTANSKFWDRDSYLCHRQKTGNMKNSKKIDLLKMCVKYFCRKTYNRAKIDVPKKHIYLASQYDELLAVSVQIYILKTHQSNIPYDKIAVFFLFYCTLSKQILCLKASR